MGREGGREGREKNKEDGMQKIKEEPNLEENNQRNKKFLEVLPVIEGLNNSMISREQDSKTR